MQGYAAITVGRPSPTKGPDPQSTCPFASSKGTIARRWAATRRRGQTPQGDSHDAETMFACLAYRF
jgi:hypothetical protein